MTSSNPRKIVSIILAAGKGTRMQVPYLHKVCFPLDGKPVIARSLETYHNCGIDAHYIVVGPMAEQVMQAASQVPTNIFYCHQAEQKGTGNAAKTAAKLLRSMDYSGDVLIVVGDKVLEESTLAHLIDTFYENESDLTFLVGDAADFPGSGRIVTDEQGNILGNVEVFDIARLRLLTELRQIAEKRPIPPKEAEELILSYISKENKAILAVGALWDTIKLGNTITPEVLSRYFSEDDYTLRINGQKYPKELLDNVEHVNLSVYLFKAHALYAAIDRISSDNAQHEEYLTDAIGILSSAGNRLNAVSVDHPQQAMAYNTPAELSEIEKYLISRKEITIREKPQSTRRVSDWLKDFEADQTSAECLSRIYGAGNPVIEEKRRLLTSMLASYKTKFGDQDVIITRAPGRVNIMGRHIDHQGGDGNMIAIDKDSYLIIGQRNDRSVNLASAEPHIFPDREFNIDDILSGYNGSSWLDFVNSETVRKRVSAAKGDWMQYCIAPVARFQAEHTGKRLKGMNIMSGGNVPIAAGLSSSSTLVVALAEGINHLNHLDVSTENFVRLCGEGEWYVGTRGGFGDHAAMKFAERGQVSRLGFFPLGILDKVPFPDDYKFVICNSREKARKTVGAKDTFNHRVACYHISRELIKQKHPKFATKIEYLRDVNPENLGITHAELLDILKSLPFSMTRDDIRSQLPPETTEQILSTHSDTFTSYPIRSVAIYGLAECERSRKCSKLLSEGAIEEFGKWMNISHNGDRVVEWDKSGNSKPFTADYSDNTMEEIAKKTHSLILHPGAYGCSTPNIDKMVDIAKSVDGVLGVQIAGAGLGGCIMALVHADFCELLEKTLIRHYYEPAGLEPDVFSCHTVSGSGVIAW